MMQCVDTAGAHFFCDLDDLIDASALPQDQARSLFPKIIVQASQAVMQPPARCTTHFPLARRVIVQHIDGNHRPIAHGGRQCGLIGKTQVLAKPEDDGIRHARGHAMTRLLFQALAHLKRSKAQIAASDFFRHGRAAACRLFLHCTINEPDRLFGINDQGL